MASRATSQDILNRPKNTGNNRSSLSEAFLKLKPESDTKPSITTVRLIGDPVKFKEHTMYKRDPENPKDPKKVPFPDADQNRSFTRVCTENDPRFGACPWCALGYKVTPKYSQNVLERYVDASGEKKSRVKILSKGAGIFDQFAKIVSANAELNEENGDNELCTFLGGEVAHDIRIKSEADKAAFGGVTHTVTIIANKISKITDEEIELLAEINKPNAEEIEAICAADPYYRDVPEWFLYGYRLENIHKPTPIKRPEQNTSTEDLTLDESDNEADLIQVSASTAKSAKATTAAASKKTAVAVAVTESDDDDPFADADLPF